MKFYGNLSNRLDENKMYCEEIKVGTLVTIYHYSDRKAYEVVEVVDQKHVFIREYKAIAKGKAMSNQWELISDETKPIIELKFRYNQWNKVNKYTEKYLIDSPIQDPVIVKQIKAKGFCNEYNPINISFGIADYYYDYEF